MFGKKPLTPYETDNLYGKVMGLPEDGGAYNTGKIIGELIPFIILPEVTVARFPLISNLLLTVLYQSIIDSATHSIIEHGVSKHLIPDVINGVAMGLINALATHGLLRGLDSSVLFSNLQQKLQKLMNELAESFGKPIVQNNGTMVLKKTGSYSGNKSKVSRNVGKYWKNKQLELIKTNRSVNEIKSVDDIKSFDDFDSVLNYIDSKDFRYTDYKYAQQTGSIKVYTNDENFSKGCLLSPSAKEAYKFSTEGYIYFLYIPVEDVAWISSLKGQYAPIKHLKDNMFEKPLTYTGKCVKYKGSLVPELNIQKVEYTELHSAFFKMIYENKAKNIYKKNLEKEFYDYIYEATVIDNEPILVKVRRK